MAIVVPDASVILKWVIPAAEPDRDHALRLLEAICDERVQAIVPSLWLYEVSNILARRYPDDAEEIVSALLKLGLDDIATSPAWLTEALAIARQYPVTFYDAAYHATAIVSRGVFVTADARYVRQAGPRGGVVALTEWQPPRPRPPRRRPT